MLQSGLLTDSFIALELAQRTSDSEIKQKRNKVIGREREKREKHL